MIQTGFAPLDAKQHNVKTFDCGKPEMNQFLSQFAAKNALLGLSSTWVLIEGPLTSAGKNSIVAYYTLASTTVTREDIPAESKLPGYPVPVVLLARLAVDHKRQGQRIGEKTLISALRQSVTLTDRGLPALGLILDVLDEDALAFYKKFDLFQPFMDDPMRLFAPMRVLRQI
jgi:hypothetical protein